MGGLFEWELKDGVIYRLSLTDVCRRVLAAFIGRREGCIGEGFYLLGGMILRGKGVLFIRDAMAEGQTTN